MGKPVDVDKNEVLSVLKKLVSIKSVNPDIESGEGEKEVSNFIAEYLEKTGLKVHTQDVKDGRFNVVGELKGSGERKGLMFNGHADTVGVRNMTIDPTNPVVNDGRLYGRGACDMKGAIAAMMIAAKIMHDSELSPKGSLLVSTVVGEEFDNVGANKLVQDDRISKPLGAVIVGEPTTLQCAIAHKGFINIEIETTGKAAHGSVPEKGIDAIEKMGKIIVKLDDVKEKANKKSNALLGPPKFHTSTIEGGREWSVIPDQCILKIEVRTIPEYKTGDAMKDIQEVINELASKDPSIKAATRIFLDGEPLSTSSNEPIVKTLGQVFEELKGTRLPIIGVPYGTEAPIFAKGFAAPTVVFGPGDIKQAHTVDEYVLIDDVTDAATLYALTAQKLLCP
jgi:acetylornithine deacetylase/succinyl-diaminopimelate desuccinylase family protein